MQIDSNTDAAPPFECVTFTSGDQNFCLNINQVREIRRWGPITALPHSPKDVLGVINLRGTIISVIDLSARFGFGPSPKNDRNVVIVAQGSDQSAGLLVQSVSEILAVHPSTIQDTPEIKSHRTKGLIEGVISLEEDMVRVLNLDAVLKFESGLAA